MDGSSAQRAWFVVGLHIALRNLLTQYAAQVKLAHERFVMAGDPEITAAEPNMAVMKLATFELRLCTDRSGAMAALLTLPVRMQMQMQARLLR
jgi:hypothetical protein